jgi:hypothetical protein
LPVSLYFAGDSWSAITTKPFDNKLIKNLPFIRIQIRAPSFQYIAKDHDFLVSDESICHDTGPEGENGILNDFRAGGHIGRFHG